MSLLQTLNSATTAYTSTGEVTASGGQYTAGGGELVKPNPSTSVASGVAIVDIC
jgi:hypothetical protein